MFYTNDEMIRGSDLFPIKCFVVVFYIIVNHISTIFFFFSDGSNKTAVGFRKSHGEGILPS